MSQSQALSSKSVINRPTLAKLHTHSRGMSRRGWSASCLLLPLDIILQSLHIAGLIGCKLFVLNRLPSTESRRIIIQASSRDISATIGKNISSQKHTSHRFASQLEMWKRQSYYPQSNLIGARQVAPPATSSILGLCFLRSLSMLSLLLFCLGGFFCPLKANSSLHSVDRPICNS